MEWYQQFLESVLLLEKVSLSKHFAVIKEGDKCLVFMAFEVEQIELQFFLVLSVVCGHT